MAICWCEIVTCISMMTDTTSTISRNIRNRGLTAAVCSMLSTERAVFSRLLAYYSVPYPFLIVLPPGTTAVTPPPEELPTLFTREDLGWPGCLWKSEPKKNCAQNNASLRLRGRKWAACIQPGCSATSSPLETEAYAQARLKPRFNFETFLAPLQPALVRTPSVFFVVTRR